MNKNVTIVTGLWDLERNTLEGWAKRDFEEYKNNFFELLKADVAMCVWIPEFLEKEVLERRGDKPTKIFIKENSDFETWNPFFEKIQQIRNDKYWIEQEDWLKDSPQACLKYYNPMMFSKMFMLNDSVLSNPFDSEYFFWIDGGITNTVHSGYFNHDKVFDNLENYMISNSTDYMHIIYPYEGSSEVHGFERKAFARHCSTDYVKYVARGGFFGGKKDIIHETNSLYYSVMEATLDEHLMGADECLFTILCHNHEFIHKFEIEGDGLVWPFFEELKKYKEIKNNSKVGLYVITFNSPNQFQTLIESMLHYDKNFIEKTKKFLLDNSTDLSTTEKYLEICKKYGFEHIKKDNIGIAGGRQFIAEHFSEQEDLNYYYFFEDDMFFVNKEKEKVCRSGFNRVVENLYNKSLEIIKKEKYDFIKLNFSEFYGSNQKQWAWYNVPQSVREEKWPNNCTLPYKGLDPNSPDLDYKNIKVYKGTPYATGEIYLCNWPVLFSREGNHKCYLEVKYDSPFEQTIMSHCYQETLSGKIKPALLLITPTEHNRFDHYDGELRKEC